MATSTSVLYPQTSYFFRPLCIYPHSKGLEPSRLSYTEIMLPCPLPLVQHIFNHRHTFQIRVCTDFLVTRETLLEERFPSHGQNYHKHTVPPTTTMINEKIAPCLIGHQPVFMVRKAGFKFANVILTYFTKNTIKLILNHVRAFQRVFHIDFQVGIFSHNG